MKVEVPEKLLKSILVDLLELLNYIEKDKNLSAEYRLLEIIDLTKNLSEISEILKNE